MFLDLLHGCTEQNRAHDNNGLDAEDIRFLQAFRRTFTVMLASDTTQTGFTHGKLIPLE